MIKVTEDRFYLTQTEKSAIELLLDSGHEAAKVNRKWYEITRRKNNEYDVKITANEKGIGIDSPTRMRSRTVTFIYYR